MKRKGLRLYWKSEEKYANIDLKDANVFKRTFFVIWSNIKAIVILTCVIALIATFISNMGIIGERTVSLSLNYEEASKGQNPNFTRFNIYELKSDETLQRVIEYAGLQDTITTSELSDHIDIRENSSGKTIDPLVESTYYISTSYTLTYRKMWNAKGISTDDMVELICKAYNDIFHERYVGVKSVLQYDLGDIDNMEYIEIARLFTNKSDQMLRYTQQRIKQNSTYRSEVTGQSFQTIKQMIQNVQDYSIKKFYAFALESGLSRDRDHYLRTLSYKNDMFNTKYLKYMIDYNVRKQGVEDYDSAMIGTVMVPSVNERREYYMSRTNIGTDYLTRDADNALVYASEIEREIIDNQDIIDKVTNSNGGEEDYNKAEELIEIVDNELKDVASVAEMTDKEYIKHTTKDYITFSQSDGKNNLKKIIKSAIVYGIATFILICVLYYLTDKYIRRKEEDRRE